MESNAEPIALRSADLNMSAAPIACDTTGERVRVERSPSSPAPAPTHQKTLVCCSTPPPSTSTGRQLGASGGGAEAGPLISFSLVQQKVELEVRGLAQPVRLEMPLNEPVGGRCVGGDLCEQDEALECRYWDEARAMWASDGCRTLAGEGNATVLCEVDHLTDFMVVVVPARWDDLAQTQELRGVESFTWDDAMVCLDNPSWGRFPFVYAVVIVLVVLGVVGVCSAAQRDSMELKRQALVAARTKDRGAHRQPPA